MKIIINRKELISALTVVNKLVNKKHIIPMSDYAHMTIKKDMAIIKTCDTSIEIVHAISCQADEEGEVIIDSLKIVDLLRKLPEEEVKMKFDDIKCIITSGTNKYQISGLPDANMYPAIKITEKDKKEGKKIELSTIIFEEGINRIKEFVAIGDAIRLRPIMGAIHIIIKESILSFYGSDAIILGRYSIPISNKEEFDFTIPTEVIPFLDFTGDDIIITITKKHTSMVSGNIHISFTQLQDEYPDANGLLTEYLKDIDSGFQIKGKDVIQSLDRLMLFVNKHSYLCVGEITDKKEIVFTSLDIDLAQEAVESVPFESGDILPIRIGFNINNLYSALKQVKTPDVKIGLITGKIPTQNYTKPIIIKQTPVENKEEFIVLVMPLCILI